GPFIVSIFAFSLTVGDVVDQLAFFLVFGIGFGLPLFLIGMLGQLRGRQLAATMIRWERPLQIVLGAVLVGVGAWDLATNLDLILAWPDEARPIALAYLRNY
ncbi:MAG: hypothetical protein ACRDE9_07400, partial [Candidatus Limnocylindria bacterium]